jgi:PAS domain S-box-containing protein
MVQVAESLNGQNAAIGKAVLVTMLVCAGAMVLGLSSLWLVLERFVVRRLRRLAAVASDLSAGNLDGVRFGGSGPAGRDEMALVAREMDALVDALRASRGRAECIFSNSPAGILFIDESTGVILDANQSFCAMLGYSPGELAGETEARFLHPGDPATAAARLEDGRISVRTERQFLTKSGEPRWVETTSTRVVDVPGEPGYILGIVIDIRERKLAEETLRTTLNLLRRTGEDRQRLLRSLVAVQDNIRAATVDLLAASAEPPRDTAA